MKRLKGGGGDWNSYHHHRHHHPSLHNSSAVFQKRTSLTDEALISHCSAKNVLTLRYVLNILLLSAMEYIEQGED
jgi:hypothetical protein